jgi:predicted O-methyltransferase YrrM
MCFVAQLRFLPPKVAMFQWRARRHALRAGDHFALVSGTRPRDLATLLSAAKQCNLVIELGTGSGLTAISLVIADRQRHVVTYDPVERQDRDQYVGLVPSETRRRLKFVSADGAQCLGDSEMVDLLYIDSSHEREDTIREVQAWRSALREGSLIIFDDFTHPGYPGVKEAVRQMGLSGEQRGTLFVHRVGS